MVTLLKKIAAHPRVRQLGPGLITGAADDDPSGIATYSQAGAQFGYGLLWTVLFTYPLMVAIRMVSARFGCITGRGLAANVKAVFPRPVLYSIVGLLRLASRQDIMGRFVIRPRLRPLGWAATAVMAVTVVGMVATM